MPFSCSILAQVSLEQALCQSMQLEGCPGWVGVVGPVILVGISEPGKFVKDAESMVVLRVVFAVVERVVRVIGVPMVLVL